VLKKIGNRILANVSKKRKKKEPFSKRLLIQKTVSIGRAINN
jgi:hypothetical protein